MKLVRNWFPLNSYLRKTSTGNPESILLDCPVKPGNNNTVSATKNQYYGVLPYQEYGRISTGLTLTLKHFQSSLLDIRSKIRFIPS